MAEVNGLVRRILVAPDSSVLIFDTYESRLKPGSLWCLYSPEPGKVRPIYHARQIVSCNYLDIEKSTDISMVPALYDQNGNLLEKLDGDKLKTKKEFEQIMDLDTCQRTVINDLPNNIIRVDTDLGRNWAWTLKYTFFIGEYLDNAETVEYALDLKSFMALCQKYGLNFFGNLRDSGRLFLDNTIGNIRKGKTTISHGWFDEYFCFVKKDPVTTLGEFVRFVTIQSSSNEQENMLRMYETKCDGVDQETAFERCNMNMHSYIIQEKGNTAKLNMVMRSLVRGVIHLHSNEIVHGAIRPQNVLIKKYDSLPDVAKITGMSNCKKLISSEVQPGSFNRDIYGTGRIILCAYTKGEHTIEDDDVANERCFENRLQFESDMDKLYGINPLVHDLVTKCLNCSISAKEIYRHFCFWPPGTFLEFLQRASDAIAGGDAIIRAELIRKQKFLYGKEWASKFNRNWLKMRGGVGVAGVDPKGSFAYDKRHITDLVKLIRNVSHHLDDADNHRLWPTPLSFETFIMKTFPGLFPAVYYAVKVSKNPTFDHYLESSIFGI